jgi:acyl-CoA reductase-like NAD-dependent aldehyde dehydrogenase
MSAALAPVVRAITEKRSLTGRTSLKKYSIVVGGKSIETANHFEVRNPATGEVVGLAPIHKARDLALQLECGSVWINKHGAIQPNAPFGGVKGSGFGVEVGEEGLFENTNVQTVFS